MSFGPQALPTRGDPAGDERDYRGDPQSCGHLLRMVAMLPGVEVDVSVEDAAYVLFLRASDLHGPPEALLRANQVARIYPRRGGEVELVLPDDVRTEAIAAGWARPADGHRDAGHVLLHGPRDLREVERLARLVGVAVARARGTAAAGGAH